MPPPIHFIFDQTALNCLLSSVEATSVIMRLLDMPKKRPSRLQKSAKPTPKTGRKSRTQAQSADPQRKQALAMNKLYAKPKPEWVSQMPQRGKVDVSVHMTALTEGLNQLRANYRRDFNMALTNLYELATHLRGDSKAFADFCKMDEWARHPKLAPSPDDQDKCLAHVFRFAAGFTGAAATDRSSRWTRGLTPAFSDGLMPYEVFVLLTKKGGIKKLAAANPTRDPAKDNAEAPANQALISDGSKSTASNNSTAPLLSVSDALDNVSAAFEQRALDQLLDYAGPLPEVFEMHRHWLRDVIKSRLAELHSDPKPKPWHDALTKHAIAAQAADHTQLD